KYSLKVLMEACKNYPLRPWEHLTFEYVMLGGVNDSPEDARGVVRLLAPLKRAKVNLIPWNPGELPYRESSPERIEEFRRILNDKTSRALPPSDERRNWRGQHCSVEDSHHSVGDTLSGIHVAELIADSNLSHQVPLGVNHGEEHGSP